MNTVHCKVYLMLLAIGLNKIFLIPDSSSYHSNFSIWLDLNNGSVWLRYHTLLIVRMALFWRVIIFLIVIEFPHTCIPFVRWLCTSAK